MCPSVIPFFSLPPSLPRNNRYPKFVLILLHTRFFLLLIHILVHIHMYIFPWTYVLHTYTCVYTYFPKQYTILFAWGHTLHLNYAIHISLVCFSSSFLYFGDLSMLKHLGLAHALELLSHSHLHKFICAFSYWWMFVAFNFHRRLQYTFLYVSYSEKSLYSKGFKLIWLLPTIGNAFYTGT